MKKKSENKKEKSSSKKITKAAKVKSGNKDLIKQLNELVKKIDKDEILFLIRQAQVFIYNKKVEEANEELRKGSKITIKKPPFSDKVSMEIKEADDGSSFVFVINRTRKFFTLEEMRKIVNLCHLSADERDASHRLYTWFKNNRVDALNDIGIDVSTDSALATIYNYVIKRYKVKDKGNK